MTGFNTVARWLHWLIAGLIVLQYVLAELAEEATSDLQELALLANHKSVGILILALAVVRLAWRWRSDTPAFPSHLPGWQRVASSVSHFALYAFLFALPVSGWLLSSATAYSVSVFNVLPLPDLVGADEALAATLESTHHFLAEALFVLGVLHILAAIKHAVIDKDDVMARMTSWPGIGLGFAALAAGIVLLTPSTQTGGEATVATAERAARTFQEAELSAWTVDYSASQISFTAEQAGAEFTGVWTDWQADVRLSRAELERSSVEVTVRTAAVSTEDAERDASLAEADWFDSTSFPTATFQADEFARTEAGYTATGSLLIKDVPSPVTLIFTVQEENGARLVEGTARLDRLALGVGTGEWLDTTWVGQFVDLQFTLKEKI